MTLIQIGSSFGPHGIPAENSHKESVSAHGGKVKTVFQNLLVKDRIFSIKPVFIRTPDKIIKEAWKAEGCKTRA